ncbi:MAG: hypothetical protein WA813_26520 [Beijerinckiaceae bacterium]
MPYVLDIYALGVILTHAYVGFGVAPRFAPVRETHGAGKSTAWKIARHLVFRPNPEAIASGAAIGRFFNEGSGTLGLDELDLTAEAKERKRIQQVWNLGHEEGASLAFVIGGKRVSGRHLWNDIRRRHRPRLSDPVTGEPSCSR